MLNWGAGDVLGIRESCARSILAAMLSVVAACTPAAPDPTQLTPPDPNAIVIGALLPFTGAQAASGGNLELAMLLAAENIGAAGGVGGRQVRILALDTRSDVTHGTAALNELLNAGVVAVVGPEDQDLAAAIAPILAAHHVPFISGGPASVAPSTPNPYWYRIVPSIAGVAQQLASRIRDEMRRNAVVYYTNDTFGIAFQTILTQQLRAAGITANSYQLAAGERSYGPLLSSTLSAGVSSMVDSIVLVSPPSEGAILAQDWSVSGGAQAWYLAPGLRNNAFLQNTPPGALNGAVGDSVGLPADSVDFTNEFTQRWGEAPIPNAYFYFDATIALSFAAAAAAHEVGRLPIGEEVARWIVPVTAPPGNIVTWQDLASGLHDASAGLDVDYRGTSGSVDFSTTGDVPPGLVQFWTISGGAINAL